MERRFTSTRAEIGNDDATRGEISGYASVTFNGKSETEYRIAADLVERISPGAFDDVLKNSPDVVGLFNHDPSNVLGRTSAGTLTVEADERGLKYSIKPGETQTGRDVAEMIKRGDVSGSSFAFQPGQITWSQEGETLVRQVETVTQLFDVGPVTYPAYNGSSVESRNDSPVDDLRAEGLAYLAAANASNAANQAAQRNATAVNVARQKLKILSE